MLLLHLGQGNLNQFSGLFLSICFKVMRMLRMLLIRDEMRKKETMIKMLMITAIVAVSESMILVLVRLSITIRFLRIKKASRFLVIYPVLGLTNNRLK
jgi:hypothetical protein